MLTGWFATLALLACTVALGLNGIGRSLWLDESWVANSVLAPTLRGMFHYPNWLQTTPPLFLLLARTAVHFLGASTIVLRSVPLGLSLLAVAAMLAVARRLVSPPFAILGTAILAFHPTVVEYFRSFKQYGGEVAATTVVLLAAVHYLQNPGRKQFSLVLIAAIAGMMLSYPTVFLLPGLVLAIAVKNRARGAILAGSAGAVLAAIYWWLIRPNYTPQLRAYWMDDSGAWLTPSTIAIVAFTVAAGIRAIWRRDWISIVLLAPCVLLFSSELLGWYPASPRTQLFVRPCLVLLAAMVLQDLARLARWKLDAAVILLAAVVVFLGVRKQFHEGRFQAEEGMEGAVRYLRSNVSPSDLLLIHPSLREGFLLYSAIGGWTLPPPIYADTGWPCCPRNRPAGPDVSTPEDVRRDLDSKIPRDFHGRIWLFYTDRPRHWQYVHVYDPDLWRTYLWNRHCQVDLYIRFPNLGLVPMSCS